MTLRLPVEVVAVPTRMNSGPLIVPPATSSVPVELVWIPTLSSSVSASDEPDSMSSVPT